MIMTSKVWKSPSLLLALFTTVSSSTVLAQADGAPNYPTKTIRMLVGFAPGGGVDTTARLMAQKFSDAWGQNVVVDNRPGASGNIATDIVAKAVPNGYTMIMVSSGHAINVSLYSKLPYDPIKDVAPISLVAVTPSIVTAHPSVPVSSVRELVALAKSKPEQITYGSPGTGTTAHLAMALFASITGIQLIHVPYSGSGLSVIAALGGQIQLLASSLPSGLPHVRSGRLKVIGVTTAKRTQLAPDLPTIAEGGVPGYEAITWYGLLTSAGTPASIINKVNAEIERANQQRDVRERFQALGLEPFRNTPEQFAELIKTDIAKWGKVVRELGVRAD